MRGGAGVKGRAIQHILIHSCVSDRAADDKRIKRLGCSQIETLIRSVHSRHHASALTQRVRHPINSERRRVPRRFISRSLSTALYIPSISFTALRIHYK